MRIGNEIGSSDWFGEIPEGWDMQPTKALFTTTKGMTVTKADLVEDGAPVVNYGQVHSKSNSGFHLSDELIRYVPKDFVKAALKKSTFGSFIFACTSEDMEGCGACIYNDSDIEVNPGGDTMLLSPKGSGDNRFFAYLFSTDGWRWQFRRNLVDVKVFHVNQTDLKETYIVIPPLSEQQSIADYLDAKCAAIDADTAKRRELVEKLKEYRKCVIAHAVTRGLDEGAAMKDSGVEWIGEIPEEWEVIKIGQQYDLRKAKTNDSDHAPLSVTMQGVLPQLDHVAKTDAHDDRKLVKKGDFVINSRSDRRGSCGIAEQDGSVSLINTVLIPRDKMNPRFYNWLFHTPQFADEFYRNGHGIVDDLWTTRWSDMKAMAIVEPPLPEQRRIADYLDAKCAAIDTAIAKQEGLVEKLGEYRKSVIHAAVTGRIDLSQGA